MGENKKRIEIIDALRGFAVVLMVIHHLLYNLAAFLGAPWWLFTNPVFDVLHYIFAGLFIFLSGVSSRFSRGNVERGAKAIVVAVLITYTTYRMGMPVWFGVLHLLGFSMMFFGVTRKLLDSMFFSVSVNSGTERLSGSDSFRLSARDIVAPAVLVALVVASVLAKAYIPLTTESLWLRDFLSILGWQQPGFRSYDYFPLLPWLFVFLLGTWAGVFIRERVLPAWFYEVNPPIFPKIGRKALFIYVLHQPVLYALVMGIAALRGAN